MRTLSAKLCRTYTGAPLATVEGLPGGSADLTPEQLRALAEALRRIADDADARPMGRAYLAVFRLYSVGGSAGRQSAPVEAACRASGGSAALQSTVCITNPSRREAGRPKSCVCWPAQSPGPQRPGEFECAAFAAAGALRDRTYPDRL
jgi:hypothetical protein